jgi:hypothetical protein
MDVEALAKPDRKVCKSEQPQYGVKHTMAARMAGYGRKELATLAGERFVRPAHHSVLLATRS